MKLDDISYPRKGYGVLEFTRAKKQPDDPALCKKKDAEKIADGYRANEYLARIVRKKYPGGVAYIVYIRSKKRGLSKTERDAVNEKSQRNYERGRVKIA